MNEYAKTGIISDHVLCILQLSTRQLSDEIMPENFPGENLRQEEREAVSTLLGFSENPVQFSTAPFSSTAQDPHGCGEPEYFVKYANRSHMYNEWVNESTLYKIAKRKLVNFKRRYGDGPVNMFLEEWAEPERLVARRKCRVGPGWELLVKWKELGYEHCTWEVRYSWCHNSVRFPDHQCWCGSWS